MKTGLEVVRQERARLEKRIEELEADNAKLREQVSTMHTVAGKVAESGGDCLTQMAHDWQAAEKRLRLEIEYWQLRAAGFEAKLQDCRGKRYVAEWKLDQLEEGRPRPDWSQAPDGAQWWAVDPDGYCHWFENEPILETVTSAPDVIGPRWSHHGSKWIRYEAVNIPLGIDWRTLIEQRPETP